MAIGLTAGGWFASKVITKLINGLIDYAKDQKNMQLGLKDELERLEKALPKIQAVANAVDQGLIKEENPPLEKWLWQLRDAADQADDLMDEMEYNFVKEKVEVGEGKVSNAVSNFKTFVERAVHKDDFLKKLKAVVRAIDDVASDVGEYYMLVQDLVKNQEEIAKSAINSRETGSVPGVGTHVFGREKEKAVIIEKLFNSELYTKEVNFAVLPIIGCGGVGKTTLAELVYNDPEVKKYFELRMWVCISNNSDVVSLTKKLYECVIERKVDFENFDVIQRKLKEELNSKRFLVVFDDAWNDVDSQGWKKLFSPLRAGKSGSVVLLTTRMETVARMTGPNAMDSVFLEGLNEQDMWDLFQECAFRDEDPNNHKELVEIGRGIVRKLKGSPLAAKLVGGILCSDLSEIHWRNILDSDLWKLEQGPNGIMPALRLTYQYLPPHLKTCFSFCSIFPPNNVFVKDDLIYMWIALGLVPRDGAKSPEDVGSEYFEYMLNRSIFSRANPVSNAHIRYPVYTYYSTAGKQFVGGYIMHDLMHDLSVFVSQGECFRSDKNKSEPIPPTVRHLYLRVGDCYELSNIDPKNIHTLILQLDDSNHPKLDNILNKMLEGMRSLRLLTLFALDLSKIPECVTNLSHLRYLSLSSFMLGIFPQSMSRLYLLETFICGGYGFENQADVLVKLINLRHLIASESFVEAIAGIGRLTSLQELCFRVKKDKGFKISELGDMTDLKHLSISNINDVDNHEEAKQANLKNKVGLCELNLQWETKSHELSLQQETKKFDEKVLDHLEPNCNLKELKIKSYMGGRLPGWESMSSLVKIEISDCHNLISLDEGLLRNSENLAALEELTIMNCKELEMPREGFNKFISLKRLDIEACPKIKLFNMLLLLRPSKLQFLRINSYVDDGLKNNGYVKDIIGEICLRELSMQSTPTLQIEEAKLLVLEHLGDNSNWQERSSRMRDYIGRWPPVWLTQSLPILEYLLIDGSQYEHSHYTPNGLPDGINKLLKIISQDERIRGYFPFLEIAHPVIPVQEQCYFAMQHVTCMLSLKKLTINLCSKSCIMPPLPVTLKELRLYYLGLKILPNFFENQSREPESLPSLVSLEIWCCPNLVSLNEGLFQDPEHFASLEYLTIRNCSTLMKLPQGGFNKFKSLKELDISYCSSIEGKLVQECFLPSTLQVLRIRGCGHLDTGLPKALKSVHSLISLELYECNNIRSLPPVEVFSRWKTLEKLEFSCCNELTSLESLLGLHSVKLLIIRECPKLVSSITSPPAWKKDEIEGIVDDSIIQTSNRPASTQPTTTVPSSSTKTENKPLVSVDELEIDDPLLLYIEPIRSLFSVRKLTMKYCSSMQSLPELLLSVDELEIDNPKLLSIEPIRSLASVRKLIISNCIGMQSLPGLPPILEELSLKWCSPELQRRCEKSGEDWPKLSHIPKVSFIRDVQLETIILPEEKNAIDFL